MKTKTSVTLSGTVLHMMDQHAADFRSRSEFVESAVTHFLTHLKRQAADRQDREILNRRADALNKEAADVLTYQAPL